MGLELISLSIAPSPDDDVPDVYGHTYRSGGRGGETMCTNRSVRRGTNHIVNIYSSRSHQKKHPALQCNAQVCCPHTCTHRWNYVCIGRKYHFSPRAYDVCVCVCVRLSMCVFYCRGVGLISRMNCIIKWNRNRYPQGKLCARFVTLPANGEEANEWQKATERTS